MAHRGVNKALIIGNLGDDPTVRYMPNGKAVANISVATSEEWKDQQGVQQSRVEWHRCVAYERLAEVIGEYLSKGSKIYLEGKLHTREWQDQQGQKRYTTEIVIQEMQMLDSKPASQQGGNTGYPQQGAPQGQRQGSGQQMAAPRTAPQCAQAAPQGAQAAAPQGGYSNARSQPMAQQQYPMNNGDPDLDWQNDIHY